jgi:hypothetical protein
MSSEESAAAALLHLAPVLRSLLMTREPRRIPSFWRGGRRRIWLCSVPGPVGPEPGRSCDSAG